MLRAPLECQGESGTGVGLLFVAYGVLYIIVLTGWGFLAEPTC